MKLPHHPRQPLTGIFVSAIAGIAVAEYFPTGVQAPLILLLTGAIMALRRRSTAAVFLFTACTFFLLHEFAARDNPGRELARSLADKPLVKATGIVVSAPREKQNSHDDTNSDFRMKLESLEVNNVVTQTSAVVLVKWAGEAPAYGDRASIFGDAQNIERARNPGQFDYASYLNRLGIYSQINVLEPTSWNIVASGCGNPIVALALKARHWVQQKLMLDLEDAPEVSGLVQGLTLGLKSETPEETREMFQRTGTLHLFVVNGLHIGMFTAIVFLFVRLLGAGRVTSILVVVPLLCFYALLTGFSTGSIRASVMAVVFLSGRLVDGKPVMLNNLAAAGLVILSFDTNELFMPGFQFSFGVVFSIILLAGPLQRFMGKLGMPDAFLPRILWNPFQKTGHFCWQHISKLLGVSTAATIGSLPFSAFYFNLLTPSSVLANLVVVPLAFLILMEGILATATGLFSNTLAALFNNVNWALTHAILRAVHLFAQIPSGHHYVEMPDFKPKAPCEITVLDLGGASAIHLRAAGQDWLIDCGNGISYKTITLPYLHSRGVNHLDGFIVTHGNTKSMGAAALVESDFQPRLSIDSALDDRSPARRVFHQWMADHNVARTEYKSGDLLEIGATKIHVLYPPPDSNARLADDKALVLRLERYGCSVLFMASSSAASERWLLQNNSGALRSDILVKNTTSPDVSVTSEFIDAVQPRAIVCCPGTPPINQAWAEDIVARGIKLFRQDQTGAVKIELGIPEDEYLLKGFLNSQSYQGTGHHAM